MTPVRKYQPHELMQIIAQGLSAQGFEVHEPEREDSRRLTITNLDDMRCQITVDDCGYVVWEYWPDTVHAANPHGITRLVMNVLDDGPQSRRPGKDSDANADIPLKGVVGRELKANGLDVGMDVYEDLDYYDVLAEIVVTNPDRRERGTVRVCDDGALTWECDHLDEADGDANQIAEVIVGVITRAISAGVTMPSLKAPQARTRRGSR